MAERAGKFLLAAYRLVGLSVRPVVPLALAQRARRGKEERRRLGERYGYASLPRPDGRVVWVHGASVGETNAVMPLVTRLAERGFHVVFTSTTMTSAALAARRLPKGAVHQFGPLDIATYVDRFLDHWRPGLVIFVESEIWPTVISRLDRLGIPLAIVNARLSQRSFRSWQRLKSLAGAVFSRVTLALAQSAEDGARFHSLGTKRVTVTGNLKFDVPPLDAEADEVERLLNDIGQRPVWVAASTHPGEEEIIADAHRIMRVKLPGLLTVIVPRHPERGNAVRAILAERRLSVAQRSRGEPLVREADVYLADTLGELGLFYRLAPVAFLGGSLVPTGGQNPIEPARLDTAILHGPHVHNFAEIYRHLDAATPTAPIVDAAGVAAAVGALLADPHAAAQRAGAVASALAPLTGALDATLNALDPYLVAGAALP
jgi:3-deoxy-D-manno-octulosonic-acid transferase